MRILFLAHAFLPEMTAGAELASYYLARRLGSRHEVAVAYVSNQRDHDGLSLGHYRGVPVMRLHARPRQEAAARIGLCHPSLEHTFLQAVSRFQPDLVHVQHITRSSLGIMWRLRALGLPFVYTLHDFWMLCPRITLLRPDSRTCPGPEGGEACVREGCYRGTTFDPYHVRVATPQSRTSWKQRAFKCLVRLTPGPVKRALPGRLKDRVAAQMCPQAEAPAEPAVTPEMLLYRDRAHAFLDALALPDRWISPSHHLRERFIANGIQPERIIHMPYVLEDLPRLSPPEPVSPVVIGYIGTLFPHKGVHHLVAAANGIDPGRARFLIAGKGDPRYTERLRAHAHNPSIEFIGEVTRDRLADFFGRIHALAVTPIWFENAPLVVQEAVTARRPVIGSDIGGIPEVITDGVNGLLFPPGDVTAMRACFQRLADDPGLVGKLAAALPAPPDPEAAAAKHERLYAEVLEEHA